MGEQERLGIVHKTRQSYWSYFWDRRTRHSSQDTSLPGVTIGVGEQETCCARHSSQDTSLTIGVPHFRDKLHLGWPVGVLLGEVKVCLKVAPFTENTIHQQIKSHSMIYNTGEQ